jgi:hypothetical protein
MSKDYEVGSYKRVSASKLLYSKSPNVVDNITRRDIHRWHSQTSRSPVPNDTVVFELSSDGFFDLQSAYLSFDIEFTSSEAEFDPATVEIATTQDLIGKWECHYNDQLLSKIDDASAWSNTFTFLSANKTWAESEGSVLGLKNQIVDTGVNKGNRKHILPLCLVDPLFASSAFLPILSNKLRIQCVLNDAKKVIIKANKASATYQIKNLSLCMDVIQSTDAHRQKIIQMMKSGEGLRFPYVSYQTSKVQAFGAMNNLRISNNNSNALSIHLLYDDSTAKNAVDITSNYRMYNQSFPLSQFSKLFIRSGVMNYTPLTGVVGLPELFASSNKCISSFMDISGSGYLDFKTFSGAYTPAANLNDKSKYGLATISCSLEKTLSPDISVDQDVINSGMSANQQGNTDTIDVDIEVDGGVSGSAQFLYNIVHSRAVAFKDGSVLVEY